MMAMAVVTALWAGIALVRVRRAEVAAGTGGPGLAGIERKDHLVLQSVSTAGDLLGRSVVYFVINAFFLVTLAIVGAEGGAGETTVLSYAYLLASYLVAGTSTAVGISRAPDMVRGAQEEDWSSVVVDTVPHGYRYAVLVSAPVLAAGAVAASPVVAALLPEALGSEQTTALARDILLLSPWLAAALLLNFVIPGLFAIGRARTVNLLAPLILALHAGASLLAADLAGVEGAVGVMVLAPLVFLWRWALWARAHVPAPCLARSSSTPSKRACSPPLPLALATVPRSSRAWTAWCRRSSRWPWVAPSTWAGWCSWRRGWCRS